MMSHCCWLVEPNLPLIHNVGKPGIPENPKELTGSLQPGSCPDQGVKLASLETLELSKKYIAISVSNVFLCYNPCALDI